VTLEGGSRPSDNLEQVKEQVSATNEDENYIDVCHDLIGTDSDNYRHLITRVAFLNHVRLDPGINQFFHSVAEETGLARHHDNAVEIIVEFAALLGVTADKVFSRKMAKIRMFVRDELQLP
jgi:predicted RNase H-related nuclease YkuK (DUF458 family)